jgi:pseudouridine-5'-phosphate glycosidase
MKKEKTMTKKEKTMTRFKMVAVVAALGAFAALTLAGTSAAAPGARLRIFGTGEVTTVLNSATIVIDVGEFGGVFKKGRGQTGKLVGDVVFAFTSRGDVAGGAPRFSIPIDDGSFDPNADYAFMDAEGCGATEGDNPGSVATLVSTQNPACHVNFHSVDYDNWADFASSNPTFRISRDAIPFIIADVVPDGQTVATYVVTDIFGL